MKEIKKEKGVFYMELEENEDTSGRFYSRKDLIEVQKRIKDLIEKGTYKNNLWEE